MIGYPALKPHDLRHGVAGEVLEQRHDPGVPQERPHLFEVDTTQIYTTIRPRSSSARSAFMRRKPHAGRRTRGFDPGLRPFPVVLKPEGGKLN